jgi:hypothetical protein
MKLRMLVPALAAAILSCAAGGPAAAQTPAVRMELNKLEPHGKACRVYMLFANETPRAFRTLKTDLVIFDSDGIIAKRLAVDGAPLAARKTVVKLFDVADVSCASIGRILLNDAMSCEDGAGPVEDCTALLNAESRAAVPFNK